MTKTIAEKMYIKPKQRVAIIAAPEGFSALNELPDGATASNTLDGQFDVILMFVTTPMDLLANMDSVKGALADGGSIWLAYPKGGPKAKIPTEFNRDSLYAEAQTYGITANQQVALDDVWSGLRFKTAE